MHYRQLDPVYLMLDITGKPGKSKISVTDLFSAHILTNRVFYAFETSWTIYQPLVIGKLPAADLVVMDTDGHPFWGIEIKLTALPDNSTCDLPEEKYGCEIVTRPDTIVYLALSIANVFKERRDELKSFLQELSAIKDWTNPAEVRPRLPDIAVILDGVIQSIHHLQQPLVMQPVWKTEGKSLKLHQNAFDIFVWSNSAFTRLFIRSALQAKNVIDRPARAVIWLAKMLLDFAGDGQINHRRIIDTLSYDTKNDKAFSVSGRVTQPLMACDELLKPRISRDEVKYIILEGGQNMLSPE